VTADVRYRRRSGWPWRWWQGRVLAMSPDRQAVELEGAAAIAWSVLDEPRSAEELRAAIGDAAGGTHGEGPDPAEVLDELRSAGLVEPAP
jgi:hypothetical protein